MTNTIAERQGKAGCDLRTWKVWGGEGAGYASLSGAIALYPGPLIPNPSPP